jgi:ketosteroid isomerase-like protein
MTDFTTAENGIRQLLSRYVDAVWRKDFVAFGDCFTEDAEWKMGGRVVRGRAACAKFLEDVMPLFDRVLMTMGTPILEVGNGTASGRVYVTEMNARKDKRPAFSIATYYDRYVLQGDRWRYSWHHFQLHYLGPDDLTGRHFKAADYGAPHGMPGHDEPATPLESEMF